MHILLSLGYLTQDVFSSAIHLPAGTLSLLHVPYLQVHLAVSAWATKFYLHEAI